MTTVENQKQSVDAAPPMETFPVPNTIPSGWDLSEMFAKLAASSDLAPTSVAPQTGNTGPHNLSQRVD